MGLVLAFLIGYSVGGRGGRSDVDEIIAAAKTIMASDEFHDFARLLRTHLGAALTDLGAAVSAGSEASLTGSVLEKVQSLISASGLTRPTSPGS